MKSSLALHLAASLAAASFLVGCTPSPETVCKKFDDLQAAAAKDKGKDKDKSDARAKEEHDDCIGQLTAAKEASSDGYKAITKCAEKSGWGEATGCIGDVVNKDSKIKDAFESWSKKKEEDRKKKELDKIKAWPDQKTKSVDGKLKGSTNEVAFTITLPESFKPAKDGGSDLIARYEMKDDSEEFFVGPSVSVSMGFGPPDLDQEVKSATDIMKAKIIKQDKNDKGYTLETESELGVNVKVAVKNGDSSVDCEAHLYSDEQKEAKDKLIPWLEKMCQSLAVKS